MTLTMLYSVRLIVRAGAGNALTLLSRFPAHRSQENHLEVSSTSNINYICFFDSVKKKSLKRGGKGKRVRADYKQKSTKTQICCALTRYTQTLGLLIFFIFILE